jgi:hypothetical protein
MNGTPTRPATQDNRQGPSGTNKTEQITGQYLDGIVFYIHIIGNNRNREYSLMIDQQAYKANARRVVD